MKTRQVKFEAPRDLSVPLMGIPHDVLTARTRESLDALKAKYDAFKADQHPHPAPKRRTVGAR